MKECTCTIDEREGAPSIEVCNLCKAAPKMLEALKRLTAALMVVPWTQQSPPFLNACQVIEEAEK